MKDVTGVVVEQLPQALYRVRLDDGPLVTAHVAAGAPAKPVLKAVDTKETHGRLGRP